MSDELWEKNRRKIFTKKGAYMDARENIRQENLQDGWLVYPKGKSNSLARLKFNKSQLKNIRFSFKESPCFASLDRKVSFS